MPALLPDIAPLRASREFRLLWSGQLISQAGSALRLVAIPYQVYVLTGSSLAVGLLGLFAAVPLIALSLWGGVIADRVDRRRMLVITQVCLALTSLALALSTQIGAVTVPVLYVLTAVGAGFGALDQPARSALAPSLLERRHIPAAIAPRAPCSESSKTRQWAGSWLARFAASRNRSGCGLPRATMVAL